MGWGISALLLSRFGSGTPVPLRLRGFGWGEVRAEMNLNDGLGKQWGLFR